MHRIRMQREEPAVVNVLESVRTATKRRLAPETEAKKKAKIELLASSKKAQLKFKLEVRDD